MDGTLVELRERSGRSLSRRELSPSQTHLVRAIRALMIDHMTLMVVRKEARQGDVEVQIQDGKPPEMDASLLDASRPRGIDGEMAKK